MKIDHKPAIRRSDLAEWPDEGFVRITALVGPRGILPVGRATFWHWVKIGLFPKPVKLGPRISAWRVDDVRTALASLVREV